MLRASTDLDELPGLEAIIICLPTPLDEHREPDLGAVLGAARDIAPRLQRGQLVVLESTTYPGTTREELAPILGEYGLTAGEDFHLAFSPERVDPGREDWTTRSTPKVVGGLTPACTDRVLEVYGEAFDTLVPVSTPEVAEMTKILENVFRSVNIALVNETAILCDRMGVDVWEVIDAAATKPFGFMKFTPGPGIGGHCIPLDPHYLAWKMRTLNYKTRFIDLASEVNSAMPDMVAHKVADALNDERKALKGSRVLVLGVAYKRDIGDMRENPALDVIRLLEERGATVEYHDPHVPVFREDGHDRRGIALTDAALRRADVVVIITDHTAIDWKRVAARSALVVDTRNVMAGVAEAKARIVGLTPRYAVAAAAPAKGAGRRRPVRSPRHR